MKNFFATFLTCFIVCFIGINLLNSNIWVMMAFIALILALVITAFARLRLKIEEMEQLIRQLIDDKKD